MPLMGTTSHVDIANRGYLMAVMDSFQSWGRKSLLIQLGQEPVSSTLNLVIEEADETQLQRS